MFDTCRPGEQHSSMRSFIVKVWSIVQSSAQSEGGSFHPTVDLSKRYVCNWGSMNSGWPPEAVGNIWISVTCMRRLTHNANKVMLQVSFGSYVPSSNLGLHINTKLFLCDASSVPLPWMNKTLFCLCSAVIHFATRTSWRLNSRETQTNKMARGLTESVAAWKNALLCPVIDRPEWTPPLLPGWNDLYQHLEPSAIYCRKEILQGSHTDTQKWLQQRCWVASFSFSYHVFRVKKSSLFGKMEVNNRMVIFTPFLKKK